MLQAHSEIAPLAQLIGCSAWSKMVQCWQVRMQKTTQKMSLQTADLPRDPESTTPAFLLDTFDWFLRHLGLENRYIDMHMYVYQLCQCATSCIYLYTVHDTLCMYASCIWFVCRYVRLCSVPCQLALQQRYGLMQFESTSFLGVQLFPSKQTKAISQGCNCDNSLEQVILHRHIHPSMLALVLNYPRSRRLTAPSRSLIPAPERTRYRCQPKKPKRTMPMMQHSTQMKTTMPWCFGHMAIPIIRCLAAEKAWCESSLQGDAFLKSSLMKNAALKNLLSIQNSHVPRSSLNCRHTGHTGHIRHICPI